MKHFHIYFGGLRPPFLLPPLCVMFCDNLITRFITSINSTHSAVSAPLKNFRYFWVVSLNGQSANFPKKGFKKHIFMQNSSFWSVKVHLYTKKMQNSSIRYMLYICAKYDVTTWEDRVEPRHQSNVYAWFPKLIFSDFWAFLRFRKKKQKIIVPKLLQAINSYEYFNVHNDTNIRYKDFNLNNKDILL